MTMSQNWLRSSAAKAKTIVLHDQSCDDTLYVFALISLLMHLVRDLVYVWVDPRIDFNSR